jgi:multidrug efflux pump subunit AcrA (membrane-fusion protein)
MKNIYSILAISVLLISCGGNKKNSMDNVLESNNLELIRQKRGDLVNEQRALNDNIKLLDEKIKRIDTTKNVPLITTFLAETENFEHVLELQGNVTTKKLIVITPEYNGILTRVYVKTGQKVSKGQLLAKIDDGGLGQQLSQLQIQSDLAKTTVTAPFSGTVDDVLTEQGNVVAAGQTPLLRLVNLDDMYIEVEVPESYVSDVVKGKKVEVTLPVLGKTIETKVRQASDFINPANRTFKIEVEVPNIDKQIKPNLTARLKINDYTSANAILIPQNVVSENAEGEQYVYVATAIEGENKAVVKRNIILTGKTQGSMVEILSGVSDRDQLVKEGARSVKDGQNVQVLSDELTGN